MTQGQFFKRSLTGLNSEFSFSKTCCLTKAEEPSQPYYLPIAGGRIIGFIPFPRVVVLCEMQSVWSRIWTRDAVSISNNDNHYNMGTSPNNKCYILTGGMTITLLYKDILSLVYFERCRNGCVRERETNKEPPLNPCPLIVPQTPWSALLCSGLWLVTDRSGFKTSVAIHVTFPLLFVHLKTQLHILFFLIHEPTRPVKD